MIVNTPSMPIKLSDVEIYDTSAEYSFERVIYGVRYHNHDLLDGTSTEFNDNKLIGYNSL